MSALPVPKTHTVPAAELACGHSVQFYETDSALIEAVSRHLCSGLLLGDVAIVIANKPHRPALTQELRLRGVDVNRVCKSGHYIDLDAQETLDRFIVNGSPDEQKFAEVIGGVVARAEAAAAPGRRVLAFGEMVALLWAQGHREATIRLEQLWNDLQATTVSF